MAQAALWQMMMIEPLKLSTSDSERIREGQARDHIRQV